MIDIKDIKHSLKNMTSNPGVYKMYNSDKEVIYVGKAKNLKKRVSSYFRAGNHSNRIKRMISLIKNVDLIITKSEADALLLENIQIKKYRPRFNILLRDDKSYPYIYVDTHHNYPRLSFYRGKRKKDGKFFGPYSNVYSVRDALNTLQKLFKVRQCSDSFFKNRARPCLQYQIERCSAPCVGLIKKDDYIADINMSMKFLDGKNTEIIDLLIKKMEHASDSQNFESAANFRDQIESLRHTCEQSVVSGEKGDVDIISVFIISETACIQVFNIRNGVSFGNETFFPDIDESINESSLLSIFIGQYYLSRQIPKEIIINKITKDKKILEYILSKKKNSKVVITNSVRGIRQRWVELAEKNTMDSINTKILSKRNMFNRFHSLQDLLGLSDIPKKLECFDVSHTFGEQTVASCVSFSIEGAQKKDYRKFNIKSTSIGDDYAAMKEALTRHFSRLKKSDVSLPDICFIDGGIGQVNIALKVMEELQISTVQIIGVSKGKERKPGEETIIMDYGKTKINLEKNSLALHLIQQIRDEAHRFAITGHRKRRDKSRFKSPLEEIPGLGPKRKQMLLKHFGGLQGLVKAGEDEIKKIPGINKTLAEAIYFRFHNN
ncbi:excinuclease ABC subunit UvrC [Gammaproteobacteria bacterium]|nr:excinuclease ABC subunit UvrC [Gammaproteobacteria bacterium]MDC3386299.1 excinuclease ABC subunit UvrC [Gammaproteobacteria bacterium]